MLEHPQHPPRYGPAMGLALAKATGPGDSQIQGKRENTDGGDESGGVVVVVMRVVVWLLWLCWWCGGSV